MKKLKKIIRILIHPAAIGILVTILLAGVNIHFNEIKMENESSVNKTSLFYKIFNTAHLKSIDLRFNARGPKEGHPDVALLTVDDKSIATEGRWPWPRKKIAKVIDRIMSYGAKVIAFDIVFSEPQDNPAKDLYTDFKLGQLVAPEVRDILKNHINQRDDDTILYQTLKKYSNRIIYGAFNEAWEYQYFDFVNSDGKYVYASYKNQCLDLVYDVTNSQEVWSSTTQAIAVQDNHLNRMKKGILYDEIATYFKNYFRLKYYKFLTQNPILTFKQESTHLLSAENELIEACSSWLESEKDDSIFGIRSNWSELTKDIEGVEPSFEEWSKNFKKNYRSYYMANEARWTHNTPSITKNPNHYRSQTITKDNHGQNQVVLAERNYWKKYRELSGENSEAAEEEVIDFDQEEKPFHLGFFNAQLDDDGTIRRSRLISRSGDHFYPSIALQAYLVANNYAANILIEERLGLRGIKKLGIADNSEKNFGNDVVDVPVDQNGDLLINYRGRQQMFPHLRMSELLNDSEEMEIEQMIYNADKKTWSLPEVRTIVSKADWIKDKIFIVGVTAIAVFDLRVTPFEKNFPGAETHVTILSNLMNQNFLKPLKDQEINLLIVNLAIGILLSFALAHLGAVYGFVLITATTSSILFIDQKFFFEKGILTPVIFPLLLVVCLYVLLTFYKYFTEERKKRELKGTFSKYVSPAIVEEVLKDPGNLELGGKKQVMTVFFSDIRGFTTISEQLDPQALTSLLNSYLTPMTELVFENKGTLDKYMGDAVMAFFGAPVAYSEHAECACRCALQSLEKLNELQTEYREQGLPIIDIGIGLNTGEMSVGNMGSETVRNYTVMGDAVNLGSRLEGINKQYGTRIIISEFTYEKVKDKFICREIDWVRVKGKVEPVKIYELVAEDHVPQKVADTLGCFKKGFHFYHEKNWSEAINEFSNGLNITPDDYCSKMYIDRCKGYLVNPPPENWDGVFVMTTK